MHVHTTTLRIVFYTTPEALKRAENTGLPGLLIVSDQTTSTILSLLRISGTIRRNE